MTSTTQNFVKLNISIALAGIVTFSLFFIMQLLISFNGEITVIETPDPIGTITIPTPDLVIVTHPPKPTRPIDPITAPTLEDEFSRSEGPALFSVPLPSYNENPELAGPTLLANTDVLAIVQISPTYPSNALTRGTEGFVVVEFNINKLGVVIEPSILISEPPGVFDRAALKAIQRWKYNPKIVDGKAVKVFGVQQKMVFTIKD